MNRQQLNTTLTLKALGVPLRMDSFDDRLIVQKALYLAQAAGHDCGHFFRWYLRGPYSPDVTRDVFGIIADIDGGMDDSGQWQLDELADGRLARVRRLIPAGDPAATARHLELLASVHFLVSRNQVPEANAGPLVDLLAKYDKDFSSDEVKEALRELRTHRLLSA